MSGGMPPDEKARLRAEAATLDPNDHSVAANLVRYAIQEHGVWSLNNNKRFLLRQAWQAFFQDWDILICPQTATTAFPLLRCPRCCPRISMFNPGAFPTTKKGQKPRIC